MQEDEHTQFLQKAEAVAAKYKLKHIGEGRHRRTYSTPSGRSVVKFATCRRGWSCNDLEAFLFAKYVSEKPTIFARCRMIVLGGVECLLMEHVNEINGFGTPGLPPWVSSIDCGQVGYTRRGKLVAYDYA